MSNARESFRSTGAVVMYFSAPRGLIWGIIEVILCNLADFNICACYCAAEGGSWGERKWEVWVWETAALRCIPALVPALCGSLSSWINPLRCKRLLDSVRSVEVFWVWSCWVLEKLDQGKGIESWRVRHCIAWKGKEAEIKIVLECLHCNKTISKEIKFVILQKRISSGTISRGNTGAVVLFLRFSR